MFVLMSVRGKCRWKMDTQSEHSRVMLFIKLLKINFMIFNGDQDHQHFYQKKRKLKFVPTSKKYAAKYKEEDAGLLGVIIDAKHKEQQRLLQEYADRMKAYKENYSQEREERIRLRDGALSDDENDYEEIEHFEERVVDEQEEEILA
mmetsp:Transcript_49239/g.74909  ORF Transcript_49239/g.74909 Transcript_49239/m.74909 type:complete len:147 (-) Transcript_49239:36-476(-)